MAAPHNSNSLAEQDDRPETLGRQLRRAREACRLSIPSAAASLHLPPRVIVALEEGNFGQFEPVYVRGYLRNYARLLDLAADPLLESYNRTLAPPTPLAQSQKPDGAKSSKRVYLLLIAACLPLLLWGTGKVLLQKNAAPEIKTAPPPPSQDASSRPSPAADTATNADVVPTQAPKSPAQAPATPNTHPQDAPTAKSATNATPQTAPASQAAKPVTNATPQTAQASQAAKPVANTTPPTTLASQAAKPAADAALSAAQAGQITGQGPDTIAIRLSASAWVSIRDQGGHRLAYENLPAGADRRYAGQAPFAVVLGNAPAATIEFNGQAFEPPKGKGGTVARFTLGGPAQDGAGAGKAVPGR